MNATTKLLLGLSLLLFLSGPLPAAEPPALVNYQGVLRDDAGAPLDGDHDMVFRFWSHQTAGDEILVDTHDTANGNPVNVSGGLFNAELGGGVITDGSGPGGFLNLTHVFRDYGDVWLEVEVDGETLDPRIQVLSAGYALNADHLDGLNSTKLLRSDTSDQFTFGTLTVTGGAALQVDGQLRMDGLVTKATTDLVTNFNADFLDGLHATDFAGASHGHPGSDITSPVSEAANADTLDGQDSSAFASSSHNHPGSDITSPVSEASNADTLDGLDSTYFLNTSSTAQTKAGTLAADATAVPGAYGVRGYGPAGGGFFLDSDSSGYAYIGQADYGITAYGNGMGGHFEDLDGSGYANVGYGNTGIRAYGNNAGAYFKDLDASGYAYVGYGNYGIDARGSLGGGFFQDLDSSGYAYLAMWDDGIRGYGSNAGGYFVDTDHSGFAYAGHGDFGISGHGNSAGGYFVDADSSGYAYVGNGEFGIKGYGNMSGGYFEDLDGSGYANVGMGDTGIHALGNSEGGLFQDLDDSGIAWLADTDLGIEAHGNHAGGRFIDANSSGYAWVGVGEFGIDGRGHDAGGYFEDSDSSSIVWVARNDNGISSYGDLMGGYFQDNTSSVVSRIAYGSDGINSTGNKNFVQNHPYENDRVIVYSSLEGDEVGTYTRGSARLVDGVAEVSLGETFRWVTNPDIGLTAHLTARGAGAILFVESLTTEELVVRSLDGFPGDAAFDYVVFGLRIGFEEVAPVREKDGEALIPSMDDHRERYERSPGLRRFNALERFKGMTAEARGAEAASLDLSAAASLRAAIQEYDPEVHGDLRPDRSRPSDGEFGPAERPGELPEAEGAASNDAAGRAPTSTAGGTGGGTAQWTVPVDEEGNVYGRSFRPSAGDLASLVEVSESVAPGDVLVIDPGAPGRMSLARAAEDSAVFGIVAAEPGVVLGADPPGATASQDADLAGEDLSVGEATGQAVPTRVPVALSGVVLCKVDAGYGSIRPGDLLTTSPTPGHAMRADDPRPGTILGKALEPLDAGTALVRVLVTIR